MCGICGWVAPADAEVDRGAARRMAEALRHRGPDGDGEALVEGRPAGLTAWLGHRRLKVVDLSPRADQPMRSRDGAIALTYNGEVYNFRELRAELRQGGMRFESDGDTEVVLKAYEAWGDAFLERLEGMFAIALWDSRDERLLLARDRTGEKPLFYAVADGRLAFGSEPKAVLACPWVPRRVDAGRIAELLTLGYVPNPASLYEGLEQVPPAGVVTFDRDGVHGPRRYWDALAPAGPGLAPAPGPALSARVAELLTAATERQMAADVPVGALLSGGIDSSLIVGLMSQVSSEPVRTFAIGFSDDASYDERGHARTVARHFGTRHVDYDVRMDAVALMDRLLWHHDQPFADSSAIPTYVVAELARRDVKVVLTGDGGDEVFGGYDRFRAAAYVPRLPGWAAHGARRVAGRLPVDHGYFSPYHRIERLLAHAEAPVDERYLSWVSVTDAPLLGALLRPDVLAGAGDPLSSLRAAYARASARPPLDRILYANLTTYLPDDLHVKMDRMTMAHSLESRAPFLDRELVELLARVPARGKIGLRRIKPVLRDAFGPLLPAATWARPKHGFGVPIGAWFRGELGTRFADEVLATDARTHELLEPAGVRRLLAEHHAGERDHGGPLWTVLTLERWLRSLERPLEIAPPDAGVLDASERLAA